MNDDPDLVAMAGQGFVDRVVDHLEDHVVQTGSIARVADVHARPFADRFQALQHLDAVGVVFVALFHAARGSRGVHQIRIGITTYLKSSRPSRDSSMLLLASPNSQMTRLASTLPSTSMR